MEKIADRCNTCVFARPGGSFSEVTCECPSMPASHRALARFTGRHTKNLLPSATHKCSEYRDSGKQIYGHFKSPF